MLGAALLVVLSVQARAGTGDRRTPHVCAAQWVRATSECSWDEPVIVKASGRNEEAAERHAIGRLRETLASLTRAAMLEAEGTMTAAQLAGLARCTRVPADDVMVACMASPRLSEAGFCYAELPADPCWSASLNTFEGVGWLAAEHARRGTCDEVADQIASRMDDEIDRLRCHARCQSAVAVRCLAD